MSHNITLSGITINNLSVLDKAVKKLSGGKATLMQNKKSFKTYRGQPDQCDHSIDIENSYGIGLTKNAKGNGYGLVFDPYGMRAPYFKGNHVPGTRADPNLFVGKLLQEYTISAAELECARAGKATSRVVGKDDSIQLVIQG